MKKIKIILTILFGVILSSNIYCQTTYRTVTTTGIKAWSSTSTWQGGVVPPTDGTATVYISAATGTYNLLGNNVYTLGTINVKTLIIDNGANLELYSGTTTIIEDFINNGTAFTIRNNPSRTSTIRVGRNLTTNTTTNPLGSYYNTSDTNQTLNFIFNGSVAQSINGEFFGPIGKTQNITFSNTSLEGINIDADVEVVNDVTNSVNSNVKVSEGRVLIIGNLLTNNGTANNFVFENNSSLVQVNNVTNVGQITYKRIATQRKFDYVYWSSPVNNFNLSSHPSDGPKYYWNPTITNTNTTQGNWVNATGVIPVAKGVIIRGPSTFTSTISDLIVNFDGVPQNGTITTPVSRGTIISSTNLNDNWNLIGNPYPSAISAKQFLTNNNTILRDGVYIWTHGTQIGNFQSPFYGNFTFNYNPSDYVLYNLTGFSSGPSTDYFIGAGQGFFVSMVDGATTTSNVTFNNSLRNKNYGNDTNTNFFRVAINEGRIWLNIVDSNNNSNYRTLIGYVEGATNDQDQLHDAIVNSDGFVKIYSLTQNQPLVIQGRQLPFNNLDTIPIGVDISSSGNYSIAIHAVDGLFENGQDIYLEDLSLNVIHNLKESPYYFFSELGSFKNRFVLRFNNDTLGQDEFNVNSILIYSNNNINIKSLRDNIMSVDIFDLLGRNILSLNNLNKTEVVIDKLTNKTTPLIIKVTTINGVTQTKTILYQ